MTKLLLVSDNHGDKDSLEKIMTNEDFDYSIHLGDALLDEEYIKNKFTWYVSGNNEVFSIFEDCFKVEELNISILHGHTRGIGPHDVLDGALDIANENDSSAVFFGHTHYPFDETKNGVRVINPGAIAKPRFESERSYAIVTVEKDKIKNVVFKTF